MFRKLDEARAENNVGLFLRTKKDDATRAGWLGRTRSSRTRSSAEIYVLSKDEGAGTRCSSQTTARNLFRTTDVTGSVSLPEGVEMVMPGDNVSVEVELITPVAMEKTMRFAIREGDKTVGAGRIAEITDAPAAK